MASLLDQLRGNTTESVAPTTVDAPATSPQVSLIDSLRKSSEKKADTYFNLGRTDILEQAQTVPFDELYSYGGSELGYVSRYKEFVPFTDMEDYHAQRQTGWEKFTNSLGQFWALSKNSFSNHFASYGREFNALTSADWNKLWSDSFGEESAQLIRASSNLYPIYETKEQQARRDSEGGLLTSFSQFVPFTGRAGNAWANLFGQLGFTAGMMGGVITETGLLAGATALTGGGTSGITAAKTALNLKKLTNIKSMWNLLRETRGLTQIPKALETANTLGKLANSRLLNVQRSFIAAIGEASIEGASVKDDFIIENTEAYKKEYGDNYLEKLEADANRARNYTANFNVPLLLASNYLTIGNLFKPSNFAKSAIVGEGISAKIAKGLGYQSTKNFIGEVIKDYPKLQKGLKFAGRVGGAAKVSFSEGAEEFLQGVGSRAAAHTFSQLDSDNNKGFGAFMVSISSEFGKSLGTREGMDEFAAGFITGFGIKGFGSIVNKVTGRTAAEKALVDKGVVEITQANSRYLNALTQLGALEKTQEAINKNDIKTAKDVERDAEISLFITLSEYGIVEDYLDELGNQVKSLSESEQKTLLQDRTVDDVVNSVKERFKAYDDLYKQASKNIGNPYKEGTAEHRLWDAAIKAAASYEVYSQDAFNRVKSLQDEISRKYPIDAIVINSALDPTILPKEIRDLTDYINKREEALIIEGISKEERASRKEEIKKDKDKLEVLQQIEKIYYDENGKLKETGNKKEDRQTSETVSAILKSMYGSESAAPADLKQSLTDVIELENDGYQYRNLYTLLSNKKLFDKFGNAYVSNYLNGLKRIQANVDKAINNPTSEPTNETYSENDFNKAIEDLDVSGEAINQVREITGKINRGEITRNPDNTFTYKGKQFTKQELFEEVLKDQNAPKELNVSSNNAGVTVRQAINKLFNNLIETDVKVQPEQVLQNNEPTKTTNSGDRIVNTPVNSKEDSEKENFVPKAKKGNTILHYFDKVLAKIWNTVNSFDFIKSNLLSINDNKTWSKIDAAFKGFDRNARLTTLSLANDDILYSEKSKEEVDKSNDIKIISDGIRYYIVTKGNTPNKTIEKELGLKIEQTGKIVVVKNKEGVELVSPLKVDQDFTEENDVAIHKAKRGDKLVLEITNNLYNDKLFAEEKNEEVIADKVHISAKNADGVTVGILRAGDFLFESKGDKSTKKFRENLVSKLKAKQLQQGDVLGEVEVAKSYATRNRNVKDGVMTWVNLSDFNPQGFKKTFFYVTSNGDMINEKQEVIVDTDAVHDRRGFAKGGIYMKIEKPNGVNHTVQVYRSDKGRNESASFTLDEFKDPTSATHFTKVGQTELNPQNPIVSKRLEVKLTVKEDISNTENATEDKQKQFDDVAAVDNNVVVTDANGNKKPLTNTSREGSVVKSDEGNVSLNDVESIEEKPDTLPQELEKSNEWENVKNGTQEDIEKWIIENGTVDKEYKLADGTVIKVVQKSAKNTFLSVAKGNTIYYTGLDSEGKRLKADKLEDLQPVVEEQPTKPYIEAAIIQKIRVTLNSVGIDANALFNKMKDAYNESVLAGTPIQSLAELTEKAGLTEDEQDLFDWAVTPVFYGDMWNFITQSEGVWDKIAEEKWNQFRSEMAASLNELEEVNKTSVVTPEAEYNGKRNRIVETIQKIFNKTGIYIPDMTDLGLMTIEGIQSLINAIREGIKVPDVRAGFAALQKSLAKIGLMAATKGLLIVDKVDKLTLGRNPIQTFDLNSIYMDLAMSLFEGKIHVRNEADGMFVQVEPNKRTDKNVTAFQKNLENLLGIRFSLQYLNAYLEINGDFKTLKQRAIEQSNRQNNITIFNSVAPIEQKDVTSEPRFKSYYKVVTSKVNHASVILNGVAYNKFMSLANGQTLYLKEDAFLTAQQLRNIMRELDITRNVPKRLSVMGQRVERIRGLEQKIQELENCS